MAWKQSLAKIKQDIKALEGDEPKVSPPPKAPPRVVEEAKPIEDEDALFLSAMGARPQAKAPRKVLLEAPLPPPVTPPVEPPMENFGEAMASLKGMKPMGRSAVVAKSEKPIPQSLPVPEKVQEPEPEPQSEPDPPVPPAVTEPEAPPAAPRRIQLAAGMAIEVDGSIDLRGHSITDARERVKERVLDCVCLGWRNLHVLLGDGEGRQEAFLEFLAHADPRAIERYAQAPIPMGGASAWILYLGKP